MARQTCRRGTRARAAARSRSTRPRAASRPPRSTVRPTSPVRGWSRMGARITRWRSVRHRERHTREEQPSPVRRRTMARRRRRCRARCERGTRRARGQGRAGARLARESTRTPLAVHQRGAQGCCVDVARGRSSNIHVACLHRADTQLQALFHRLRRGSKAHPPWCGTRSRSRPWTAWAWARGAPWPRRRRSRARWRAASPRCTRARTPRPPRRSSCWRSRQEARCPTSTQ